MLWNFEEKQFWGGKIEFFDLKKKKKEKRKKERRKKKYLGRPGT